MRLNKPEITIIGGGTGSFTLLQDLKDFTTHLNAIVNMSDSGGSTGELRDELGVLPPGDVRQCLAALSDTPQSRRLLSFRFPNGKFANSSLGNLILSGLELEYGSFETAIEVASAIFHITGKVIPVSLTNHSLIMHDGDQVIKGEASIDAHQIKNSPVTIEHEPRAIINPKAEAAIQSADMVVIAPGNLYCSLLAALSTSGMKEALASTKAKIICVSNLVNKAGQTDNWHVVDYVNEIEKYIGKDRIEYVIYNNEKPSPELLSKYAKEGEFPVLSDSDRFDKVGAEIIGGSMISKEIVAQDKNDTVIRRTLIRHDAIQVGRELMRIFYE
jgi:uncharacterized cofD-like protein